MEVKKQEGVLRKIMLKKGEGKKQLGVTSTGFTIFIFCCSNSTLCLVAKGDLIILSSGV